MGAPKATDTPTAAAADNTYTQEEKHTSVLHIKQKTITQQSIKRSTPYRRMNRCSLVQTIY